MAATPPRIEPYEAASPDEFPVDAMNGERNASASDSILLMDPVSGNTFERVTNPDGTALVQSPGSTADAPTPPFGPRGTITPGAVTDAGTITSPFAERAQTLQLANSGAPGYEPSDPSSSASGPILQLTSPSDAAEYETGYTTLGDPVTKPEVGKTYVFGTVAQLPITAPDGQQSGFTATPSVAYDSSFVLPVNPDSILPAQQWTVLSQDPAADGTPQFQLSNRADGTCLAIRDVIIADTDLCDHEVERQTFQVRELPADAGESGYGIYYPFTDTWMGWQGGLSTEQPEGEMVPVADPGNWTGDPSDLVFAVQWLEVQQPSAVPPSVALPAEDRADFPFDLVVDDLDGVKEGDVITRDESAIAYAAGGELRLSVVDYNAAEANDDGVLVTTVESAATIGQAATGGDYAPLAVNTADLDGDGLDEIIVTFVDASGTVMAALAQYRASVEGDRSLAFVGSPTSLGISTSTDGVISADAAVFDFTGDGVQEIAWVGPDPSNGGVPTLWTVTVALEGDTLTTAHESTTALSDSAVALAAGLNPNARVRVESGQFQSAEPGTGGRQVAVTYEDADGAWLDIYAVFTADGEKPAYATSTIPAPVATPQVTGDAAVSLAVGGFTAANKGQSDRWGLAVSAVGGSGTGNAVTLVQPAEAGQSPSVEQLTIAPDNGQSNAPRPGYLLTSYDRQGESLILGDPIVFTVEQLHSLNLVAGQPPAHSDWLDGEFVNVSRNIDFNLEIGGSDGVTYDNTASQETNQTFQLALSGALSETVKAGVPDLAKTQQSGSIAAKFEGTFGRIKSTVDSADATQTQQVTQQTADDDIVNAIVQDYQVYRYPVWSIETWDRKDLATSGCELGCYGYWDVVIPGTPDPVKGSGKQNAWFAPSWQNGNALSYPPLVDGVVPVTDAGTYSYLDDEGDRQYSNEPFELSETELGSTESSTTIDVSDTSGSSSSETTNKGWDVALDLAFGVSGKVKIPTIFSASGSADFGAGFNPSSSFTGSSTGATDNTHSSDFQINMSAIDEENRAYSYGASYYVGSDGAPRVTYGVALPDDGISGDWWQETYGEQPDPALNLAYSTGLTYSAINYYGEVQWNDEPNRQQIRGFTARMPYTDDPTTSGAPYAAGATIGDPVVFDVEVANYSLVPMTKPLTVDFLAMRTVKGHAVGEPVEIGSTTVDSLQPQEHKTVSSPTWTAEGSREGDAEDWMIFVILDRDDTMREIHGWAGDGTDACPASSVEGGQPLVDPLTNREETLQCGQNNQGFGQFSVYPDSDGSTNPAGAKLVGASLSEAGGDVIELAADSDMPQVTVGESTTVFLRADAEAMSRQQRTVIVYDGDPADGDVVATTRMQGVRDDGASVTSFTYSPTDAGTHELHAVMLGTGGDPDAGLIVRLAAAEADDADNGSGGDGSGSGGSGDNGSGSGDGDTGSGAGADGASDAAQSGDLATTGASAVPWILVGVGGLVLIAIGLIARRFRAARPD